MGLWPGARTTERAGNIAVLTFYAGVKKGAGIRILFSI